MARRVEKEQALLTQFEKEKAKKDSEASRKRKPESSGAAEIRKKLKALPETASATR